MNAHALRRSGNRAHNRGFKVVRPASVCIRRPGAIGF